MIFFDSATVFSFRAARPLIATSVDTLPDPDTLPEGQWVILLDCYYYGVVAKRPHLEPDGTQRQYYHQAVNPGFAWRPNAGAATTTDRFGRYDADTGLVYPITATTDVANCIVGASVALGAACTIQRIGRATSQPSILASQTLTPGCTLTYDSSGRMVAWASGTSAKIIGYYNGPAGTSSAGGFGTQWQSYLPFV